MPLVIISGLPCSGKTLRSRELYEYVKDHLPPGQTVHLLSEEDYGAHRATEYASSTNEKKARGNFFSAVERLVSPTTIVIADGLNYIKGYRYQLYCVARAANTPHCVVSCVLSGRVCRERNESRLDQGIPTYPKEVFEELLQRFEEPSNQARWDSPLFTVGKDELMDWAPAMSALQGSASRPPSFSTAPKAATAGDLLMVLDKTTQKLVERVLVVVKERGTPCSIELEGGAIVNIGRPVLSSDLQRLRRQFIHMNRLHQADPQSITRLFVHYLNENLK